MGLSATQAQDEINLNFYEVNADKPGALYNFSFAHLTDTHIGEGDDDGDYGSTGVWDEVPNGDVGDPAIRLRRTVNWLNANHDTYGIDFVLVTGDLTDSGERSEFLKFKEIMDGLEISYVPMIGNHDVWPYTSDFRQSNPNGDSLINVLFADTYADAAAFFDDWDDGSRLERTWNPEAETYNYLHNYYALYKGFHFLFLDFHPRYPAARNEPGIGPEAEILGFEDGTWPWVQNRIEQLDAANELGDQNVFLLSHHPPMKELWNFHYAFTNEEKGQMMDYLFAYKNHLAAWLAGHIHRSMIYAVKTSGLQPYTVVECVETGANKQLAKGLIRIVDVYESELSTAVSDQFLAQQVDIYPNPGNGLFRIFLKDNIYSELKVSVYDLTGKQVVREQVRIDMGSRLFTVDLRDQPKGIYRLLLETRDRYLSFNLAVQ